MLPHSKFEAYMGKQEQGFRRCGHFVLSGAVVHSTHYRVANDVPRVLGQKPLRATALPLSSRDRPARVAQQSMDILVDEELSRSSGGHSFLLLGRFSTTGCDWDGVVRDKLQIFPIAVCGRGVEEGTSGARAVVKSIAGTCEKNCALALKISKRLTHFL